MSGLTSLIALFLLILENFERTSAFDIDPRVINGHEAHPGQFPWQVFLAATYSTGDGHWCGGTIIHHDWVLTSAYCIDGSALSGILAGTIDANNIMDAVDVLVESYIVHEEFDNVTLKNDIALLRLEESLIFSANLSSIALADFELDPGVSLLVSGWGHSNTDTSGNYTQMLQYATVKSIDHSDCEWVYGTDLVPPTVMCTNGSSGESPCFGDAGGPLVLNKSEPALVGVFSYIAKYGCEGYPAVYTKVSDYRDWILEKIGV